MAIEKAAKTENATIPPRLRLPGDRSALARGARKVRGPAAAHARDRRPNTGHHALRRRHRRALRAQGCPRADRCRRRLSGHMAQLEALLAPLNLPSDLIGRLAQYGRLVLEANRRVNLTAARSEEAIAQHISDSLSIAPFVRAPYVDVGSGAGFPAIPIAIVSGLAPTAIEATAKKARLLEAFLDRLGLGGTVISVRAELAARRPDLRERFASGTARAVGQCLCGGRAAVAPDRARRHGGSPERDDGDRRTCRTRGCRDDPRRHSRSRARARRQSPGFDRPKRAAHAGTLSTPERHGAKASALRMKWPNCFP